MKNGAFGACLMREPELVGDCVAAMKAQVTIPVTVKCRIGVDEQDPETALGAMAECVIAAGCDALIVHARKAWLKGLSPKENRDVPPLDYALVRALKQRFPDVPVVLNGGLSSLGANARRARTCRWRDGGARGLSEALPCFSMAIRLSLARRRLSQAQRRRSRHLFPISRHALPKACRFMR